LAGEDQEAPDQVRRRGPGIVRNGGPLQPLSAGFFPLTGRRWDLMPEK